MTILSRRVWIILALGFLLPWAAAVQVPAHTKLHPIQNKAQRQEPCWKEAGISKPAMQQRKTIEQNTRAEIQSVCANSSLTPQQRREQIREIRERTRQQIESIISPEQREALRSCQESRSGSHPGGGGMHLGGSGRGEGPCGEMNETREPNEPREPQQ